MPFYEDVAAIAVGHNNTAGLALISSLVIAGKPLLEPFTVGAFSRGERRFKANGAPYVSGSKSKIFVSFMTLPQYTAVRDTYEGEVTVHGMLENTATHDFNANLWFEEIADYEPANVASEELGWSVVGIKWNFNKVTVIP